MTINHIDIVEYTTSSTIAAVLLRALAEAPPIPGPGPNAVVVCQCFLGVGLSVVVVTWRWKCDGGGAIFLISNNTKLGIFLEKKCTVNCHNHITIVPYALLL